MDKDLKQMMIDNLNEMANHNMLGKIDFSAIELFVSFIDRLDRLWKRQLKLDEKSISCICLDGDRMRMPYDCPTPGTLLKEIKENLEEISESRKECVTQGKLKIFEADYNRLEKAYYNLKIDIESYVRLHPMVNWNLL